MPLLYDRTFFERMHRSARLVGHKGSETHKSPCGVDGTEVNSTVAFGCDSPRRAACRTLRKRMDFLRILCEMDVCLRAQ